MIKGGKLLSFIKNWAVVIVSSFLIFKLTYAFVFFNSEIPSTSMHPTLQVKDRLFTWRIFDREELQRGDIVVFKEPNHDQKLYVKRIIGLPGDTLKLEPNGYIYVNNKLIEEPYVENQIEAECYEKGLYDDVNSDMELGTYKVPENHVFLLGDNRINSLDARYWDNPYISINEIEGKPLFRVWPLDRFGDI